MSFKDLGLQVSYDSDCDDILKKFYIPVLSKAIRYHRLAGFFSSSALAVAAKGIAEFIQNEGKMKIIVGAKLQKNDVEAIIDAKESAEKVLAETMLKDLTQIEDEITADHVKALAWLIARKDLEIKVAVLFDLNGQPMDFESASKAGLFHQKIGILEDHSGNFLSFSGSINETATAWKVNVEEFKVFRSWVEGELPHLESDNKKFEKYWYGQTERLRIFEIPEAVKNRFVEIAPTDPTALKTLYQSSTPKLRDYQKEAINLWLKNSGRGILEMATATGKTFTALGCLEKVLEKEQRLTVVITCPFIHLTRQWKDNSVSFSSKRCCRSICRFFSMDQHTCKSSFRFQ